MFDPNSAFDQHLNQPLPGHFPAPAKDVQKKARPDAERMISVPEGVLEDWYDQIGYISDQQDIDEIRDQISRYLHG